MANLFPSEAGAAAAVTSSADITAGDAADSSVAFGSSVRFDFETGEFALTPTGRIAVAADTEAWLQWCAKALLTERYRYLVYSRGYGQEFDSLMGLGLPREAAESEIARIATETLMADPRTAAVRNFKFSWERDRCDFTCEAANVRDETGTLQGSVVNRA